MKIIEMTMGLIAVVDDLDWELVSPHLWRPIRFKKAFYAEAVIDGTRTLMHRLVLSPSGHEFVDHINGVTLDNRRANLRIASITENNRNSRKIEAYESGRKPSSIYKGVFRLPHRKSNPWRAKIVVDRTPKHIGVFSTEIEAARAYDTAAKQYFGPFARLNFPSDQQNTVPPEEKFFQEGTTKCGSSRSITGKSEAVK